MTSTITIASSGAPDETVLLNTFVLHKQCYRVLFHAGEIVWESEKPKKNDKTTVPLGDVIAVQLKASTSTTTAVPKPEHQRNRYGGGHVNYDKTIDDDVIATDGTTTTTEPSEPIAFVLHYARRHRATNRWRQHSRTFHSPDTRIVRLWHDTLHAQLTQAASEHRRPRRLLMFINPYGGARKATQIYEKCVRPLFQLADIDVTVVESERPNHIRDVILRHDALDTYDGLVCIGGDGTFSEVFNGLVLRAIHAAGLDASRLFATTADIPRPAIPIGIIPGGSTDTVAYCLHGTTDIATACLHICLGQRTGLDLASVSTADALVRLYASVMSYGYLGDVAADSEKFRWMGPRRYDYSGFKKFMANRGYESEIAIRQQDVVVNGNAGDGCECCEQCERCAAMTVPMTTATAGGEPSVAQAMRANDVTAAASVCDGTVNPWKIVRGKFFMVNGANVSCACRRSPNGFSKFGHIGDGCVDLVLIRHTSFFNNLRLLLKLSSARGRIAELPFVEIYRVRQFQFRTLATARNDAAYLMTGSTQPIRLASDELSQWNCDGEVIHGTDIVVRSHCQLVTVFRRGKLKTPQSNGGNIATPSSSSSSACGGLCGF